MGKPNNKKPIIGRRKIVGIATAGTASTDYKGDNAFDTCRFSRHIGSYTFLKGISDVMASIAIDVISKAIISGIEKAHEDYRRMSGGYWVWTAAEYMLTTYIAKELSDMRGAKFVTVESNGLSSMDHAGAIAPGPKPSKARLSGRFDILLWWGKAKPRAVIEVKNQPGGPSCWYHDIDRITSVLRINKDKSTIKFGAFAYYYSAADGKLLSAEEKVFNKFERVEQYVREKLPDGYSVYQVTSDIYDEGSEGAWGAACLIIKRS